MTIRPWEWLKDVKRCLKALTKWLTHIDPLYVMGWHGEVWPRLLALRRRASLCFNTGPVWNFNSNIVQFRINWINWINWINMNHYNRWMDIIYDRTKILKSKTFQESWAWISPQETWQTRRNPSFPMWMSNSPMRRQRKMVIRRMIFRSLDPQSSPWVSIRTHGWSWPSIRTPWFGIPPKTHRRGHLYIYCGGFSYDLIYFTMFFGG